MPRSQKSGLNVAESIRLTRQEPQDIIIIMGNHLTKVLAAVLFLAVSAVAKPIPVILDTDIGDDIDDTWALGLLLKSPELDLKLVVGDHGAAQYRAKLLAKFLETVGRTDVPIGVGLEVKQRGTKPGGLAKWIKDYDLNNYPGKVYKDGVQALIDAIMQSPEPVALVCIGPLPNIAAALKREPRIAQHAKFVGMQGSIRVGYGGSNAASAEWNVKAAPESCRLVFNAPWDMTITPLDTCGFVNLTGDRYAKVRDSQDPIAAAVVSNYRIWAKEARVDAEKASTTLYDTVAVYLAIREDLCQMERLPIRITDDGFTKVDSGGKLVNAATAWKDLDGYRDFLVVRLAGR